MRIKYATLSDIKFTIKKLESLYARKLRPHARISKIANVLQQRMRVLKEKNPDGLAIWGGPNFPLDRDSQEKFLKKHNIVDIYIPIEGEMVEYNNFVFKVVNIESNRIDKIEIRKKS